MITVIFILDLGEFIYFPISQALGKLKATSGDLLPNCHFFGCFFSSLPLALYLPNNFVLRQVQAHIEKDTVDGGQKHSHLDCIQTHMLGSRGTEGTLLPP